MGRSAIPRAINAHVSDERGRFVPGLTASDFAIADDGVAQAVTLVGTGDVGAEVFMAIMSAGAGRR